MPILRRQLTFGRPPQRRLAAAGTRAGESLPALALALALVCLPLAACDPVTAAAVGGASSLTATKKLPPDHIASWMMGRDCSYLSYEATGEYCPEKREIDRSRLYCYRTLGDVDCHDRPDLYRNSERPLASPPPQVVKP